jgi:putative flippase GtrA
MINKIKNQKFIRFVFSGSVAFIADYTSLELLFNVVKLQQYFVLVILNQEISIYIANMIAILISLTINFSLNKFLTFENNGKTKEQVIRFALVIALNYILNNIIFGVLFELTNNLQISKIIATGSQVIWTFFLYKYFVFKLNVKEDTKITKRLNEKIKINPQ